ncbi:MAG: trifunctional transcriptional regulator/proline dehydrogenase/L-glutamate gamma-semialdehyde dehydrogenase, partial [Sphingomonadaceae bacterium]|nr:trifunctional transcriptional regulator/proline dehydrogenase/L-glutamate gamma-semialdehyde dehydrogenase [Sphingomonadaceae bacterium]
PLHAFADWLDERGDGEAAIAARRTGDASALGVQMPLPGVVGETNLYALHPRGRILLRPATRQGLFRQMAAILATGNSGTVQGMTLPPGLPPQVAACFNEDAAGPFAAALVEGDAAKVAATVQSVADLPGPIVSVHADAHGDGYCLDWLLEEVSTSINTTAAGGNASLMMIG